MSVKAAEEGRVATEIQRDENQQGIALATVGLRMEGAMCEGHGDLCLTPTNN